MRSAAPDFDITLSTESVALLSFGPPWPIHESAVAVYVTDVELHWAGGGGGVTTVHVRMAGDGSARPASVTDRTANVCCPTATDVSSTGDSHAANAAESSEHSKSTTG